MDTTPTPRFTPDISSDLRREVTELLNRWLDPAEIGSAEVSVLAGGAVNRSFFVRHSDSRRSVLRVAARSEVTDWSCIDMSMSIRVSELVGEAGVGPRVLGAQLPEGHSLIEFLDGVLDVNTIHQEGAVPAIGEALRKAHELPTDGVRVRSVFDDIDDWQQSARDHDLFPSDKFKVIEPHLDACRNLFAGIEGRCLSHRDLNPQNCMFTGQEARIIDWDFAGVDTPYLDLAMLIDYAEMDAAETKAFMHAVIDEPNEVDMARLQVMQLVNSVREWSWGMTAGLMLGGRTNPITEYLPGGGGEHADFYSGYRDVNWQRAGRFCSDPAFKGALRLAQSDLPAPGFR
jgi:aminoglycoside phosphotransferase (APT) family kinase protein